MKITAVEIARKTFVPHELKLSEAGEIELAFAQLGVVDHDGDVTLPGAFPTKDVPMSAYGHTSWDGSLPVGKGTISEAGDWAVFKGGFFMKTEQGRNTYETVKEMGALQEYSYGYQPVEFSFGVHEGKDVRVLKLLDTHEVSPVLKGAGIGTHTLAIKSGSPGPDAPYAEHATWIRDAVKAFLERTDARVEWRTKEGRALSAANRTMLLQMHEGLMAMHDAMGGHADDLRALLDATDPDKADKDVTLDVLLAIARRLKVPV